MSFLFKMNGVQQQKTTKILMIMNFIQAGCGWFMFIACIMLGNIKAQYKNYKGTLTDSVQRTYNPLIALFSIIGIFQTLFGTFIALILLGKLDFVNNNKKLWMSVIHYGLIFQFGFIFFVCLEASTESTIFAGINDTQISNFYSLDSSSQEYKYDESLVVYSRYLIALAILQFLICLPIAIINLYALHTRHVNYEAFEMEGNDKADDVIIDPSVQPPSIQSNTFRPQGNGNQNPFNPNYHQQETSSVHPPLDTSKPLQDTMLPK